MASKNATKRLAKTRVGIFELRDPEALSLACKASHFVSG